MTKEEVNRLIYPLNRFKVLGFLTQVQQSDYSTLIEFTGLTDYEVAKALRTLETAGYVLRLKSNRNGKNRTLIQATPNGRSEFRLLVRALQRYAGG